LLGLYKKIVGIDIGLESIKIVCVEQRGRNNNVIGFNNLPLDGPIIESDHIKDKNKIAALIKKGFSEAKPHSINAKLGTAVMPEFLVFSKTIQLPKMKEEELKSAALNQASQYIPVSIDDVNIDSQPLIIHPDEPIVDMLVVATPKALVNEYLEMFKLVGLNMLAFETKALSVVRSVILPTDKSGILILEIGTVSSRISIVDSRQIRFVSTINAGGDQIIHQACGETATREEFLSAKYKVGLSTNPEATNMVIDKIVEDIVKAVRYHQNRDYKASHVSEIRLCGSGALIPGITSVLESKIKIKTVLAQFPIKSQIKDLDQRYATALGLAMYREDTK